MARFVSTAPRFAGAPPPRWAEFEAAGGVRVAASRSSETRRIRIASVDLYLKRYRYSPVAALRGSLRNTFLFRPSRAAREFRMLGTFHRAGFAPEAAAYGEWRTLGFLREAFVASVALPATPLAESPPAGAAADRRLGRFLGELHRSGRTHGRLFARNLLATANGGYALVDLDRARAGPARLAPRRARARDLGFLAESLAGAAGPRLLRILAAYRRATGESRAETRRLLPEIAGARREARRRLDRRNRVRGKVSRAGRTSPSSSGARPG